jgi:hypothetical protein
MLNTRRITESMQLVILISRSTLTKMPTGTVIAENVREKKDKGSQHNLGQNVTTQAYKSKDSRIQSSEFGQAKMHDPALISICLREGRA